MEDVGRSEAESRSNSFRYVLTSVLQHCRFPSSCHNLVLVSIRSTPGLPCTSVLGRRGPLSSVQPTRRIDIPARHTLHHAAVSQTIKIGQMDAWTPARR